MLSKSIKQVQKLAKLIQRTIAELERDAILYFVKGTHWFYDVNNEMIIMTSKYKKNE